MQDVEQELGSLQIRTENSRVKSSLVLTNRRLTGTLNRGIFGSTDTVVAIEAIDSVMYGWKRHPALALASLLAFVVAVVGLASPDLGFGFFVGMGFVGVVLLLIFLFVRPAKLLVHSGTQVIGGVPVSKPEAEQFKELLIGAIAEARRGAGATGSTIGG